jgi:RimJ/RimL family protein N-acetyltransferase
MREQGTGDRESQAAGLYETILLPLMAEPILETPRLSLREMTWEDLDFLAVLLGDARVMRHYPNCCTHEESEAWLGRILERYEKHGHAFWLVSLRATDEPIGQVGLLLQHVEEQDESEIGYMIHAPHWRQGYASEAASAVRDHAFGKFDKSRVISLIRPVNVPSQRVALRIGLKPERLVRWHDLDHLVFSLARPSRPATEGAGVA